MWYVYFLELSNGDIYVGFTSDLKRRYQSHQRGQVLSTKAYCPIKLRAYVAVETETKARERERYFKCASGKTIAIKRFLLIRECCAVTREGHEGDGQTELYQGGCLCGNIRFSAKGPAFKPHGCSCKMCQRHSGGLAVAWVEFAKDDVAWTGPGGAPSTWQSSNTSSRAFCPVCGSTVGAIDDAPVVALALGGFASVNPAELAPVSHAFAAERPAWRRVSVGN
jgi:predicted GIY-YIG superfamily endonuclease